MKTTKTEILKILALCALLFAGCRSVLDAQEFSIDWFKVAGGGGTSTNSQYAVSGTIGQPDAIAGMSGGSYSLAGGFWGLIAVPTPGAPLLSIFRTATNSVVITWPAPSTGFVLQQNSAIGTTNWANLTTTNIVVGGQNQVTISAPKGIQFFRLSKQ